MVKNKKNVSLSIFFFPSYRVVSRRGYAYSKSSYLSPTPSIPSPSPLLEQDDLLRTVLEPCCCYSRDEED